MKINTMNNSNSIQCRRKFIKGAIGFPVVLYTADTQAVLPWILRFLFRGRLTKSAFRRGARAARVSRSYSSRSSRFLSSTVNMYDGYTLASMLSDFTEVDPQIIHIADHIARQAKQKKANSVWIANKKNYIQLQFENLTNNIIHHPEIILRQTNLETGYVFDRPNPIVFLDDWGPGFSALIPDATDTMAMTISSPGIWQIQPYILREPNVVFDDLVIVVADPKNLKLS